MLVVFFTALNVESEAVLSQMTHRRKRFHPDGTLYEEGRLRRDPRVEVAHVEVGMGVERTAQHVERAIRFLSPQAVVFVGVAGGVRDCEIGDVVVATKTYQYEYGVAGKTFRPRPQTYAPGHLLEQLARSRARGHRPRVLLGPVATGSKVVHSSMSAVGKLIEETYSDAVALDMEGHALYAAAAATPAVEPLLVRGVSDLLDGKAKADAAGGQERAAKAAAAFAAAVAADLWEALSARGPAVAPNRLPADTSRLFGRNDALDLLSAALTEEKTNLVTIVAWAGAGKTALVRTWCEKIGRQHLPPDGRLFTWSFYRQGSERAERASSDDLFIALLEHAGLPGVAEISPWRRVELAIRLIREEHVLLVLDGMEPLQQAGEVELGRVLDAPLRAFLEDAARDCLGLVVVTSRVPLTEIPRDEQHREIELPRIDDDAGVEMLRHLGLRREEDELRAVVEAVNGHCLSMRLVARYFISCAPDSDVTLAAAALAAIARPTAKVDRLLGWYEDFLQGTAQVDLLRSLGLVDRDIPLAALGALHADPPISGLNAGTAGLPWSELEFAVRELIRLDLVQEVESGEGEMIVDAHPLIRETYARRLREADPGAWTAGHERLFDYFDSLVDEPARDHNDLAVLYQAVHHATLAGLGPLALDRVLRPKIQHGDRSFATKRLQVATSDLAALRPFFGDDWRKLRVAFEAEDAMWLRSHAVYDLRVLGRIPLALELCLILRREVASRGDAAKEAVVTANASHLSLIAGRVEAAIDLGRSAVARAEDLPEANPEAIAARRSLANALLHAGALEEAARLSSSDEKMGNQVNAAYPAFLSPVGFRYGQFLVATNELRILRGRGDEALAPLQAAVCRFSEAFAWMDGESGYGLARGLVMLVLSRLLSLLQEVGGDLPRSPDELYDSAEAELRTAATQDLVTCALLFGARIYSLAGDSEEAAAKLRAAVRTARRFDFPLYETTALVEEGRNRAMLGDTEGAAAQWRRARAKAHGLGYGLELARLDAFQETG